MALACDIYHHMGSKTCSKCRGEKSEDDFPWANKAKGRRSPQCKQCKSAYDVANRDRIYAYQRQWSIDNPEKVKASSKKTRSKRRRQILDYQNLYWRERRKTDPVYRLRRNVSACIKEALKRQHSAKNGSCLSYFPYTIDDMKRHLERLFEPWMTWDNWGRYNTALWDDNDPSTWTWQIDHIIPQSDLPYSSNE